MATPFSAGGAAAAAEQCAQNCGTASCQATRLALCQSARNALNVPWIPAGFRPTTWSAAPLMTLGSVPSTACCTAGRPVAHDSAGCIGPLALGLTCLLQLQGWLAPECGELPGKAVCPSGALLLQAAGSRLEVLMQVRVHSCSLIPPSAQGQIVCSISCLDRRV